MDVLFCDNPLDTKAVDPDYDKEFGAARENNLATHLFSFEMLTPGGDALHAVKRIKPAEILRPILYRGWMLKPKQYAGLYEALLAKNYRLINSPTEYQNCHYLPDSYRFIKDHTPETIWLPLSDRQVDFEKVFDSLAAFGDSPLIIKDYVKSQKHDWDTACFIPSARDRDQVRRVIGRFLQLQGSDLNEGLVIRRFVALHDLAIHSKSGMPLKQEYRLFFLNNQLLGCYDYWEEGEYAPGEQPPIERFQKVARNVESHFFSMDVAKTEEGDWIIIELGDGQVAGLPDQVNRGEFYERLKVLGG